MNEQIIAEADDWLKRSTRLSARQRASLAALAPELLDSLAAAGPLLVGIGGSPGTGKSTLARLLRALLHERRDIAAVVALDDYYLTRPERTRLAETTHPLLATRGVPGTHDLDLLLHDLDSLAQGATDKLLLPRFDKRTDDRAPAAGAWKGPAPRVVFLEGWCVGCPPPALRLGPKGPINETERTRDPDGHWRQWVSDRLEEYERRLHRRLQLRWCMTPPDWDSVIRWRWQQERELGVEGHLRSIAEVRSFLATFQRLDGWMQSSCASWADATIRMDHDHLAQLETAL